MAEDSNVRLALVTLKLVGYCFVFIAGTLLNILLFIAVTRKRIRHGNTSKTFIILMQNLAVADLLLLVLSIPFDTAWHKSGKFPYGEGMCKILWPLQTASFQAVVFTYVILSFHRTYGVKMYLFGQIKSTFGYVIILAIWIASIATVIPYMVFLKHTTNPEPSCDEEWKDISHRKTYTVFLFLLQYLIPLLVMTGFFFVTWRELKSYRARGGELTVVRRTDRHYRVTRMLIIYLCTFAILMLPHQIIWFILDFGDGDTMAYFFHISNLLYVLTYSITVSNPVLFFVFNVEFRSDMWYFIRCYCCRKNYTARDEVSDSFSMDGDPAQHSVREGVTNSFELQVHIDD